VPSCSVEGFQYRGSELTGPLCLMVQGSMLGVSDLFVDVDWMASMMAGDVRVDGLKQELAFEFRVKFDAVETRKLATTAESGSGCPAKHVARSELDLPHSGGALRDGAFVCLDSNRGQLHDMYLPCVHVPGSIITAHHSASTCR
jgi:hypothetical protein